MIVQGNDFSHCGPLPWGSCSFSQVRACIFARLYKTAHPYAINRIPVDCGEVAEATVATPEIHTCAGSPGPSSHHHPAHQGQTPLASTGRVHMAHDRIVSRGGVEGHAPVAVEPTGKCRSEPERRACNGRSEATTTRGAGFESGPRESFHLGHHPNSQATTATHAHSDMQSKKLRPRCSRFMDQSRSHTLLRTSGDPSTWGVA